MKKGGNKKPTKLKILEGNPGKRPLPQNEPLPNPREPVWAKKSLSNPEKKVWDRLAPVLLNLGLLCESDGENFANVCRLVARIEEIDKILAQPDTQILISYTESAPNGTEKPVIKINPLLPEQRQLMKDLRLYAPEFGLTPRGRVGLSVGEKESSKSATASATDW